MPSCPLPVMVKRSIITCLHLLSRMAFALLSEKVQSLMSMFSNRSASLPETYSPEVWLFRNVQCATVRWWPISSMIPFSQPVKATLRTERPVTSWA